MNIHRTRKTTVASVLLTSVVLLGTSGCGKPSLDPQKAGGTEARDADDSIANVVVVTPQRKTLERYSEQPGEVVALEETPIYARLAGYVQSVSVDIGDEVRSGQTLAILSVPELAEELKQKDAFVAQARAHVAQAEASLEVSKAAVDTAAAKMEAAQAGVVKFDADVKRWESESGRISQLAGESVVTRKAADEALHSLGAAKGARQEAESQVKSAKALLRESQSKITAAQADVRAAQARATVAQADDDRTKALVTFATIKAPFQGIITQRNIHTGHFVQPATTGRDQPLFVVTHSETVRVVVNVPETDAGYTNKGDAATVRLQSLDNKSFTAPVTRTASALDTATRTLRTEIELANSTGELRPGMYCAVSILVEKRDKALAIPLSAVLFEQGKPICAAIVQGRIVRKPLGLGLRAAGEVEVTSGLDGNESIVPRNPSSYREGQRVNIVH